MGIVQGLIFMGVIFLVTFVVHVLPAIISRKTSIQKSHKSAGRDMQQSDIDEIAKMIDCDQNSEDAMKLLAVSTATIVRSIELKDNKTFLCTSDLASCDTLIFCAFMVRALFICNVALDRNTVKELSDDYIRHIRTIATKSYNIPFDQMFNNRIALYQDVYMADYDPDKKWECLIDSFEFVLKNDYVQTSYVPYDPKHTPVVILGIDKDMMCRVEVGLLLEMLSSLIGEEE